jgi:hypothetical protein
MRLRMRNSIWLPALGLAGSMALGLPGAGPARAEGGGAQVTAVVGDAVTGSGRALENHSAIADDEKITLGKDDACSILIDDDALLELCEETEVTLERDPLTKRRIVRVNAGEVRIVVEPRLVGERIEIHTPAAIATILGTIVHVGVDPQTRETTLTSKESKFRVVSSDPNVKGSTTVTDLEQLVMRPGDPPPKQPRRLEPEEVDELGGCLVDFHQVAGDLASHALQLRPTERIAAIESAEVPWDSPGGPAAPAQDPADDIVEPAAVCSSFDCAGASDMESGRGPSEWDDYWEEYGDGDTNLYYFTDGN